MDPGAHKTENLEDKVRNMILSKSTVSDGAHHEHQQNHPHRSVHPRPPNRTPRGPSQQLQPGPPEISTNSAQSRNSNNSPSHRGRGNHRGHRGRRTAPFDSPTTGPSNTTTPNNGPRPWPPHNRHLRQPRPHQAAEEPRTNLPPDAPKVLQRSRNGQSSPVVPQSQMRPQYQSQIPQNPMAQIAYLEDTLNQEVPKVEMTAAEVEEKEAFRRYLERVCQNALAENCPGDVPTMSLVGFGSLASGFATAGSDMDLAVVLEWKHSANSGKDKVKLDIPRLLERAVLDQKLGGRLLTRTRVPILKVCQQPTADLYQALYEERKKWDELPEEEKYPQFPPLSEPASKPSVEADCENTPVPKQHPDTNKASAAGSRSKNAGVSRKSASRMIDPADSRKEDSSAPSNISEATDNQLANGNSIVKDSKPFIEKPWLREKVLGPLDFPKTGVGVQCDINFDNPLGLHNTRLLRCYSLCDSRVRPMVLFVKSWAKRRKINSSYSGTLSSYGWVLMVLHYLVNIAKPPVCPNLQLFWRPPTDVATLERMLKETMIQGYAVRFWSSEAEILQAAQRRQLTLNTASVGTLLRGFFQYFSSQSPHHSYGATQPSFYWTTEVLSLRTPGGIRLKQEKGWTGARTTVSGGKEVRHRYLFAIEDPFELDHNVARTVTHNGIVAIRDEFRRAWRILNAVGNGKTPEGGLFDEVVQMVVPSTPLSPNADEREMATTMENLKIAGNDEDAAGGANSDQG